MRVVDLLVESKFRPYQEIIVDVMKLLMNKMEVAVKGKVLILEIIYLTKKGILLHELFFGFIKVWQGFHDGCNSIV